MNNLKRKFKKPAPEYRSAPFWSWNSDLSAEELKRQVNDMKNHGMGGFFMHSREGLETEYMSKDWLKCIRETVDEAAETDMKAWLYDEDRWPSGFAGGLIAEKGGDANRAKLLVAECIDNKGFSVNNLNKKDKLIAVFTAEFENDRLADIRRVDWNKLSKIKQEQELLVFKRIITESSPWFNG
ncbi:MAG: hypothetical protein ACOCRV_01380, partial [bacterium]